jgi:signal transduction histidine kinase
MKPLIPTGRSLRFYGLISWLIPAAMAVIVCLFVFIGSAVVEYRNEQQRTFSRLLEESNTVARRISAELLIGPRGAPHSVSEGLRTELKLDNILITGNRPMCWSETNEWCQLQDGAHLIVSRKVPIVSETVYVSVAKEIPSLSSHFRLVNLLWSTLPIAIMLLIGLTIQRSILRRYFMRPVQALVETSTGVTELDSDWPSELRDISERLYRSFEQRDEAIFSQIARGVVHDLRTLIQSPLAALELSTEAKDKPLKRLSRLENLEKVAAEQLPKMRQIIDTTLDGSREIAIRREPNSLEAAILGTKHTLQPLLTQTETELEIVGSYDNAIVSHDAVQLERAFTNLLKNGIEAAQENARTYKKVLIEITREDRQIVIDFEDSGSGLKTHSDRLFRPLKSTKVHGSGLGLVVSRKIIAAHGGKLIPDVSTHLGGAKFRVIIPKEAT